MERKYLYIKKKCGVDIYIYIKTFPQYIKSNCSLRKQKTICINIYIYIYIYKNV